MLIFKVFHLQLAAVIGLRIIEHWTATSAQEGPVSDTRVFAIANQKGGVGKTTTSINLAAYLANAGRRTLVIDLDPQSNTTTGLGVDPHAVSLSIYELLVQDGISPKD